MIFNQKKNKWILDVKLVVMFVCLSGRLPRKKESGCPIRDSASRPREVLQLEFQAGPTQPGLTGGNPT